MKKVFKSQGISGIKLGYQGSRGYLTELQKAEIIEWLKNQNSWNLDELVAYV